MAEAVVERHGGEIPRTMDELKAPPGVGRKTPNVVLGNAFGIDEGVVVDTHVQRGPLPTPPRIWGFFHPGLPHRKRIEDDLVAPSFPGSAGPC